MYACRLPIITLVSCCCCSSCLKFEVSWPCCITNVYNFVVFIQTTGAQRSPLVLFEDANGFFTLASKVLAVFTMFSTLSVQFECDSHPFFRFVFVKISKHLTKTKTKTTINFTKHAISHMALEFPFSIRQCLETLSRILHFKIQFMPILVNMPFKKSHLLWCCPCIDTVLSNERTVTTASTPTTRWVLPTQ
jgi:hypothetical protein